jgi:hypothetical protein
MGFKLIFMLFVYEKFAVKGNLNYTWRPLLEFNELLYVISQLNWQVALL